ncbi:MAG: HDOD domain-containing protein [Desulfobacteraceae bacterium]|jgi:signal transduction histidine kinase/HD-like signal output (HDOD) protein
MPHWNSSYYRSRDYNRVIKGTVDSIINEISFLPVEAEIYSVFLESIKQHNKSTTDLTKYIALSPSLTFNILNLAHSPFYSGNKDITGLDDALKEIGKDIAVHLIKDILIRSSVSKKGSIVSDINSRYYGSLKSAHLSALISEELKFSSSFTAYVAALLHNIGSFALSDRFPMQYSRIKSSVNIGSSELVSAEDHALGVNHCFLGARMVEHWSSFPFIADALFYHHHPLEKIKQASKLVKLVYFSSMADNPGEDDSSLIIEAGKELFNFTENQIDEYVSIAELKVQNRLMHLGIEVSDNNSESVYQPQYEKEEIVTIETGSNSLLSVLIDNVRNSDNKKDSLNQIGRSIHILTGLSKIFYFEYNKGNKSLDGLNIGCCGNTEFSDNFSVSMDTKSSIIVTSFLMGMDINSLDRVNNKEPALFDLQMLNYMGTAGLYCLPLVYKEKVTGIIVLGVNPSETTAERETIGKLRYFSEAIISSLAGDEIKDNSRLRDNKNIEYDSIQTRKLIHEINNPLSAVKNYLKVLSMKLDDINVENNEIRIIDDELNRITKLLKEFKTSSADKKIPKTASSINSIISDTILLVKNSRVDGPPINIDFEMDENIPDIMIDKDAFRQVLINLINNSIEAMPTGGNISVGVRYKNGLKYENLHAVSSEDDDRGIEISIADDGPGFPDQLRSNIFKNQSTTKADHDGLGLLIVHELVKKMGGSVTLDDQGNKGTRFKITLPAN